ncbi:MAG: BatA domain-containing protein, partial [Gemmatimonadota bacterium]|nr:BatA domain-containing protein [Gemmatimonadota bacterium]
MISFLYPALLAGLVAAAIPILLHLIARRSPPTVAFPAVRYLVDTRREHHSHDEQRPHQQQQPVLDAQTVVVLTPGVHEIAHG